MSSDEVAIRVRDVSKHYLMFNRPEDRLKQSIVPRLQRLVGRPPAQYYRDFEALRGVSFEVKRGETVGIIGRNGCGKSTLLQIVCGTLSPTSGTIEVDGRIAALLELGSGFNPEFTGRENVYMNCAILGLSRSEVDDRFDDIAQFADIGDFVEQPVKTYSSGMYVRLAFATAINVDPDILVVDEALAVGDEAFQRKCFGRIEEIQSNGATILFVSHGTQTIIQLCTRALLIDAGALLLDGRPKAVVSQYQRLINLTGDEARTVRDLIRAEAINPPEHQPFTPTIKEECQDIPGTTTDETIQDIAPVLEGYDPNLVGHARIEYESQGALIRSPNVYNTKGQVVNILQLGKRYIYQYEVAFDLDCEDVAFGMGILTMTGFSLGGANSVFCKDRRLSNVRAGSVYSVKFEFECILLPGVYALNSGVTGINNGARVHLYRIIDALLIRVANQETDIAGGLIDFGIRLHASRVDKSVA